MDLGMVYFPVRCPVPYFHRRKNNRDPDWVRRVAGPGDHRLRAGSTGNLNLTFMTVQINLWCFVVHMCEEIYATGV
jgi:hypothetical protein